MRSGRSSVLGPTETQGSPDGIVAGKLSLNSNGTFHIETSYDTTGAVSSFEYSGTCYSAETSFRMVWNGGGVTDLTLRGDTLLLNKEGTLFSYLRR